MALRQGRADSGAVAMRGLKQILSAASCCRLLLLSQIHNIILVFALGFTKTESCDLSVSF